MISPQQHHLSVEELLLFAELELPPCKTTKARAHLSACSACRLRLQVLESTFTAAVAAHSGDTVMQQLNTPHARLRLQAALREQATASSAHRRPSTVGLFASVVLSVAAIAAAAWITNIRDSSVATFQATRIATLPLPRRALTPGSLRTIRKEDVCQGSSLANDPPVRASTAEAVFNRYAVPSEARSSYAMDYLIAPSLGGTDNANNIWPEPASSAWNAADKDRLEDHLHALVCEGALPLAVAQNDLARDWIAAYKKYFHTDQPGATQPRVAGRRLIRTPFSLLASSAFDEQFLLVDVQRRPM
jgi:hypothetical protein